MDQKIGLPHKMLNANLFIYYDFLKCDWMAWQKLTCSPYLAKLGDGRSQETIYNIIMLLLIKLRYCALFCRTKLAFLIWINLVALNGNQQENQRREDTKLTNQFGHAMIDAMGKKNRMSAKFAIVISVQSFELFKHKSKYWIHPFEKTKFKLVI